MARECLNCESRSRNDHEGCDKRVTIGWNDRKRQQIRRPPSQRSAEKALEAPFRL
jgi:hypothetical protein